ncbi:MAG: DUF4157 domain-containing protein [Paenibacillaceae bacterium]|nr:DUF4157 domain-containing protein [Paenibacillaceae bacterium]
MLSHKSHGGSRSGAGSHSGPSGRTAAGPSEDWQQKASTPSSITPGDVMGMQAAIGNRGVQSLLGSGGGTRLPVQAKLTVGPVGDAYEQEADAKAKQVVQHISAANQGGGSVQRDDEESGEGEGEDELQMKPAAGSVQRSLGDEESGEGEGEDELQMKPAAESLQRSLGEEESGEVDGSDADEAFDVPMESEMDESEGDDALQMKPAAESLQRSLGDEESGEGEGEDELQMKPAFGAVQRDAEAGGSFAPPRDIEQRIQAKRGSGQSIEDGTRGQMEDAFGADFSSAKIHNDAESDELSRSIGARAFTLGNDVFFRQGEYNPGNEAGQELLAHELTHVVQQSGGSAGGGGGGAE